MRLRKKVVFLVPVVFSIIFFINLFLSNSNRGEIRGEIVVWANEVYYPYFIDIANEFEESNRKVDVKVINVKEEEYLDKIVNTSEKYLPNVVQLNFLEIDKIKDKVDFIQENKDIIEIYIIFINLKGENNGDD